jgi:hypothetical protein
VTTPSLLLTRAEVAELTAARTKAGQIAVLRRNGIHYIVAADGWPSVPRVAVESPPARRTAVHEAEPNWGALG